MVSYHGTAEAVRSRHSRQCRQVALLKHAETNTGPMFHLDIQAEKAILHNRRVRQGLDAHTGAVNRLLYFIGRFPVLRIQTVDIVRVGTPGLREMQVHARFQPQW